MHYLIWRVIELNLENSKDFECYINDIKNYKRVRMKQYITWVAKPTVGTKVTNKITNVTLCTTVEKPYVLSGTRSDYTLVSEAELCSCYILPDNTFITPKYLRDKEVAGLMEWQQIQPKLKETVLWGCFIPETYHGRVMTGAGNVLRINDGGIAHGKGDFIVCRGTESKPFVANKILVNGLVFADCYDNRGWQDKLQPDNNGCKRPAFDIVPKALQLPIAQSIPDKYRNAYKTKAYEELKQRLIQLDGILDRISSLTEEEAVGDKRLLLAPNYTFPESVMRLRDLAQPMQNSYAMGVLFPLACYVMTVWASRNLMTLWRFHNVHSLVRCGGRIVKGVQVGSIKLKTSDGYLFSMVMHGIDTLVVEVQKEPKTKGAVRYTKVKQFMLTLDDALEFTKSLEYADNMIAYRKEKTFDALCSPANVKISGMPFTKAIMESLDLVFALRPPTEEEVATNVDALLNLCCATVKSNALTVKNLQPFYNREQDKLNQTAFLHIDGDNDMSLQLSYKIEIKGTRWGIRVAGKSANHVYNRYFKSTAFLNKPTKPIGAQTFEDVVAYNEKRVLFANEMFLDICRVLGVSPLRRFFYDPNYKGVESSLFGPVLRIKGDTAFEKPELAITSGYTEFLREYSETITVGETVYTHNFKAQVYKGERIQEMNFEIMGYNEKEGARHKKYAYRGKLKLCFDVALPVFLNFYQLLVKQLIAGLRRRFKDKQAEEDWMSAVIPILNTTFMHNGIALFELKASNKSNWMLIKDTEPVYDTERTISLLKTKLMELKAKVADRPMVVLYAAKDSIQGNLMVFGLQGATLALEEYSVLLHNEMTPDVLNRMSAVLREFDITFITEEECDYIHQNIVSSFPDTETFTSFDTTATLTDTTFISDFELFEAFKKIPEKYFLKEYGITAERYAATKDVIAMEIAKFGEVLPSTESELTYINVIKGYSSRGVPETLSRCLSIIKKYSGIVPGADQLINLIKRDDSYLVIEAVNKALLTESAEDIAVRVDEKTGYIYVTKLTSDMPVLDEHIVHIDSIKRNQVERILDRKGVAYSFDYTVSTDMSMQNVQKVVAAVTEELKKISDGKQTLRVMLNDSTGMLYVARVVDSQVGDKHSGYSNMERLTDDIVPITDISIAQLSDELDTLGLLQDFAMEHIVSAD